jgi:L-alanine-DL-glutamate epimerase-like enolase superfamily enzyme
MSQLTRRTFLVGGAALAGGIGAAALWPRKKPTDVRIERIVHRFEEFAFRAPFRFAQAVVTRQTMLTVDCTVRTRTGKIGTGFGIAPLNYTFSYPSNRLSPNTRLQAMQTLADEIAKVTAAYTDFGHPIEANQELAPLYWRAAADVSEKLQLADPIPKLCTLVTAGAFDAALHDAFGKTHGVSCFHTYGPEFMNRDLAHYLGKEYQGEYPNQYVRAEPKESMPLCHLISAVDPIAPADNTRPIGDGLPETLPQWIDHNGLVYFKIKLNGNDLAWDVDRMRHIDRVTSECQQRRGLRNWSYLPDFNEKCPHVDYFIAFLRRLRESAPACFQRIEYVEQPTHRDLPAHPENDMHEAAKLRPVVIDESVIDVDSVLLAKRQGWTGAVVKSPKGLTHMLLIACVVAKQQMLTAGGDMSCPGAALIQTASFQARLPGITSIEANARQFLPAANKEWEERFPGMFRVTDGLLRTGELTRPGLGA